MHPTKLILTLIPDAALFFFAIIQGRKVVKKAARQMQEIARVE